MEEKNHSPFSNMQFKLKPITNVWNEFVTFQNSDFPFEWKPNHLYISSSMNISKDVSIIL
jgi:hypothetical protein